MVLYLFKCSTVNLTGFSHFWLKKKSFLFFELTCSVLNNDCSGTLFSFFFLKKIIYLKVSDRVGKYRGFSNHCSLPLDAYNSQGWPSSQEFLASVYPMRMAEIQVLETSSAASRARWQEAESEGLWYTMQVSPAINLTCNATKCFPFPFFLANFSTEILLITCHVFP